MKTTFKTLFQEALSTSGMTKVAIAQALGVSDPYIHALLSGRKRPTISRLEGIRDVLSLDEATFQKLLEALVSEDPELRSLSHHTLVPFCEQIYVPFVTRICTESKIVGKFHTKKPEWLDLFPWIVSVDVLLDDLKLFGTTPVIRLLLTKPDGSGIGLGLTHKEHGFRVPTEVSVRLSIYPQTKEINAFSRMLELTVRGFEQRVQHAHNRTRLQQHE